MQIEKFPNGCCTSVELFNFWEIKGTEHRGYGSGIHTTTEQKKLQLAKEFLKLKTEAWFNQYKIMTTLVTTQQEIEEALVELGFTSCFKTGTGVSTYHNGTTVVLLAVYPPDLYKKCLEAVKGHNEVNKDS